MEPNGIIDYFAVYGPFAVLFAVLFWYTLKTNAKREELYRQEIADSRAEIATIHRESEERSIRNYEVLSQFAEKYDLVISELRDIKSQIVRREA